MRLLVTGGCGFIGSSFIRYVGREHADYRITNLDAITYAGNPENLRGIERVLDYSFVRGRVEDRSVVERLVSEAEAVVHFAAESHVDRSIRDAAPFVTTNVLGTQVLLEASRRARLGRFVHVSTDEVYGALGEEGVFSEGTPFAPRSPYAASKAAADLLALSYHHTHGLPVSVVRPSNNYGPRQLPEKLIPLAVTNLIEGRPVPVYGDGRNVREWLFVEDCCRAIDAVLHRGRPGEAYNIGSACERRNIDVVREILAMLGKGEDCIEFVSDRPGHDFRYALASDKVKRELGWEPRTDFSTGLRSVVDWYRDNADWWKPLKARLGRG